MKAYNIKDKGFWEDFKGEKFAINCETIEEFKRFLMGCEKQGLAWRSGKKVTESIETKWNKYEQTTCSVHSTSQLQYAPVSYYDNKGIRVLKFKDIFPKTYNINEVMNFKIGTEVRCIDDGSVLLIKEGLILGEKILWSMFFSSACRLSSIYFGKKFELVEEWEEVEFMKAMEAYYSNKTIKCSCDAEYVFTNGGLNITDLSNDDEFMDMVFNGKWFIKK